MQNSQIQEAFRNTHILIVGGAGFVGSNLCRSLLEIEGCRLTVVDNLLSSERDNLPFDDRIRFMEGSICDTKILLQLKNEFDYVFHLATFHGNQSSIADPLKDHKNNTLTTLMLFERIKHFSRIRKVVYSSAGCSVAKKTFDDPIATTEDAPIEVLQDSPYSISKIVGEFYSVYYHNQLKLPVVRVRFQNVYGPGEVLGAGDWRGTYATVWRNVVPTFVYKSLNCEALPLENEGAASRDFIYVDDICRGLLLAAANGSAGEVYNLGSGVQTTIAELAQLINEMTGNKKDVIMKPRRTWDHSGKRFASVEKSKKELGFGAQISIQDGIQRTVAWTRDNCERIEKCISKHDAHMKALKV